MAQAEKLGEGLHADGAFAGSALFEGGDFGLGVLAGLFVGRLLLWGHFEEDDLFELFGKFWGDGYLVASENVGAGLFLDALLVPLAVVATGSGGDAFPAARHDVVEQGHEVVDTVFDGGTREENTALGVEGGDGFGVAGTFVFDVLGFVTDDAAEVGGGEVLLVAYEGSVGGDYEVVARDVAWLLDARGAVVDEDLELGGELFGFAAPVFDEGCGADHEAGKGPGCL